MLLLLLLFTFLVTISWEDNVTFVSDIAQTPVASSSVTLHFNVSFPSERCCPVLYLALTNSSDHTPIDSTRACFNDALLLRTYTDRWLWQFDEGMVEGSLCTRRQLGDDDSRAIIHCSASISLIFGYDVTVTLSLGYPCGSVMTLDVSLDYRFDMTPQGQCNRLRPLNALENTCRRYYTHFYSIPFMTFTEGDPNVYFAQLAFDNVLNDCYSHVYLFACLLVAAKCDPVLNVIVPPCRQMCMDYVQGCGHLQNGGVDIGCSIFPASLDPDVHMRSCGRLKLI